MANTILVVNSFMLVQFAPKRLLHHIAVFHLPMIVFGDHDVAALANDELAFAVEKICASAGTENASVRAVLAVAKDLSTMFAGVG